MTDPVKKAFGEGKKFYICDPHKNEKCSGRFQMHCTKQCFCTTNPLYSTNGKELTYEEYYSEQGVRMHLYGYIPREVREDE